MKDDDIDSLKTASLHRSLSDVTEETLNGMTEEDEEPVQKPVQKSDSRKRPAKKSDPEEDDDFDNDEEDDDEVNPALNKVMMVLGIGGFIILAVIIFFIIGHAAGFFGGSHNKKESDTQSVSTESVSETAPASSNAEVVIVPDLSNKTETEAKAALNKLRLGVSVQKGSSDDVPEGRVYDQSPAAGVKTDVHTQVTIYISTGKETFKLDDVTGMDYDQAQSQLENDGLKVSLEFEYSDSVDKDEVIRTSPEAGSQVAEGDTVTIVASKGKETKFVTVPYVIGYDLDTAISMIKDAGLTYDGKSSDYSDSVPEGEVMNQSIGSGQSVEEGTSITLTVSLGSKVSSYTASISIENPFGAEIVDSNGNSDTYSEGQVTVVVYKPDGSSETVYDQYATEESLPGSVTTTSSSAGSGSVYAYINGIQYASYEVDFD